MNPGGKAPRFGEGLDAEVRPDEPLAPKTSVRVGGAAELFVRPGSVGGLVATLARARDQGLPVTVLGGGANTLVGDAGVPGVTLKLPSDLFPEEVAPGPSECRLSLGAGAPIARVVGLMKAHGLVGAEFLAGIPGTLGGAVAMNAGTKTGECMSVVEALEVATADGVGWLSRDQVRFGYRHTELPGVVTRVRLLLPRGDGAASHKAMEADLGYRRRTQPLGQPTFGSVFRNPPGDFAGRLIEGAGLKGHTVGGAQFSLLHANWIVNLGDANARDVAALIELARARVQGGTGIELIPEVIRVGVFQ
ncbi:MAG: UDP-N-acetylmuramate dehydrogenase [Myxococcaceae bacterium]